MALSTQGTWLSNNYVSAVKLVDMICSMEWIDKLLYTHIINQHKDRLIQTWPLLYYHIFVISPIYSKHVLTIIFLATHICGCLHSDTENFLKIIPDIRTCLFHLFYCANINAICINQSFTVEKSLALEMESARLWFQKI